MNPDHQLLTGTSPECGVDFRLWVYTDGTHQVAVRPIGSLDSWPAAVTLHPYANVVADGPREMFPREVPTPPSVHLRDGWVRES